MGLFFFFFFFDSQDGSGFIADDEIDALIHDLLKREGEVSWWILSLIKQKHGHERLEGSWLISLARKTRSRVN